MVRVISRDVDFDDGADKDEDLGAVDGIVVLEWLQRLFRQSILS